MSEERILDDIAPPPHGWDRLLARRDAAHPEKGLGLPLATAAALALAVFLLRPQSPQELQLPWAGARLLAQPSEGVGLRHVGNGEAIAMASPDPAVQFYWVEPTPAP